MYTADFRCDDMLADDWILCDNWLPLLMTNFETES